MQPHHAYNRSLLPPAPSLPGACSEPGPLTNDLAFIHSLTHATLLAASNTVYLNCLDTLANKDQEINLLKDHIFNLQYVSHLSECIYAECLIEKPTHSNLGVNIFDCGTFLEVFR
jgi:hypothetical protein